MTPLLKTTICLRKKQTYNTQTRYNNPKQSNLSKQVTLVQLLLTNIQPEKSGIYSNARKPTAF